MKCPDCHQELKHIDCKGVMIHECWGCKGKWFERDELQRAQASVDNTLRWLDFDPFGKDAGQLSVASEGRMCPKCAQKMQALKYMQSQLVIDKCGQCKGVWLHSGELKNIIRYLKNLVDSESAGKLAQQTFKEFIEIFGGSKGVVSEVKDFLAVFYLLELRISVDHPDLAATSRKIYENLPFR